MIHRECVGASNCCPPCRLMYEIMVYSISTGANVEAMQLVSDADREVRESGVEPVSLPPIPVEEKTKEGVWGDHESSASTEVEPMETVMCT